MIDLTKKSLPHAISVNGKDFYLNTDYRVWIKFIFDFEECKINNVQFDINYLFVSDVPKITEETIKEILLFLSNKSATPNYEGGTKDKVIDYLLDGDYIFSALYAKYGIDITNIDMHWHKFKALVDNVVGVDTLLGIAQRSRSYKKKPKNHNIENDYEKDKKAWALPKVVVSEYTEEEIDEFNEWYEKR